MKFQISLIIIVLLSIFACKTQQVKLITYETESLSIQQLTKYTFIHTSYLPTKKYGKVPCNGLMVIDQGEAVIIDTPHNDSVSMELINWIRERTNSSVKAVVATHFHVDCLGGLNEFHQSNIPSYANQLTVDLAKNDQVTVPLNGFENYFELKVGRKKVSCEFLGEGHTKDNIVCYVQDENVLFGGCLVKADGAGKGNLNDANVAEWSNTVTKVRSKYPAAKIVVPGHGKAGDTNLLNYTIELFKAE